MIHLSATERQRMGEELKYQTVLIIANRTAISRSGTLAASTALHYQAVVLKGMGIYLDLIELTDHGFISR